MKKIITLFLLIPMVILITTGCEDITEINDDPNRPAEVSTDFLLTSAQRGLGLRYFGIFDNVSFGMTISQYWAQNEYSDEVRYQYRPASNNTFWLEFYTSINDLEEIIRINSELDLEDPNVDESQVINQNAVANIMKVWAYHNLVDIYGNVPYTDALQGSELPNPSYDSQEDIYENLITLLQESVNNIDPEEAGFTGGDVVYAGDLENWIKFGNSLLLRMGMRVSEVNSTLAEDVISGAASGAISSNADNAAIQWISVQPSVNPLYVSYVVDGRQDYVGTENFVALLNNFSDPRLSEYFSPAAETGTFVGLVYGLESAQAAGISRDAVSQLNPQIIEADFEGMLMDYAETSFILAEAAQNGWIGGSPAQYYENGIRASMEYWGITSAPDITNYIAANPYNADNLAIQKYIALYTQGWQSWAEIRRLDIEEILTDPSLSREYFVVYEPDENFIEINGIPKRRIYPNDEQTLNGANYSEAESAIGGDDYDNNLFWDID